ncbi:4-oxalomesaconate tautomerase [Sphingopyxis kveilinensis]|uniref:4-oxalomesaconate tautomerase n=1 Tax=Sphingopyxis kveilinensis TaxID=3114367 RepID=UPI003BAF77EF
MWMRGGTSKGGFFLASDLPSDTASRNAWLARAMGSPDSAQADGMGGGHPLTSKVAIISTSARSDADLDYYFLQVVPETGQVADDQNCGNMLAGVLPFAIERGLLDAADGITEARVLQVNTGTVAALRVATPGGRLQYGAAMDPKSGIEVEIEFRGIAGSKCGELLPTGKPVEAIAGIDCTLIDNGMPCIIVAAAAFGVTGYEDPADLEANAGLRKRIENIRLEAGPRMGLGDVTEKPVPKIMLVAPAREGGALCVRSFIPHRAHRSVGVLAAVTVATAAILPDSVATRLARGGGGPRRRLGIEHPSGTMDCILSLDADGNVASAGLVRSARKLMDGIVFG